MKKQNILVVVILLMTIGFASIATNLFVNGSITIGNDIKDYDIKLSKITLNGVEDNSLILDDGKRIRFNTNLSSSSELVYEVTNNSSLYDAKVSVTCTALGTANVDLYTIDTTNTPGVINAKTSGTGSININTLGETNGDIVETFECKLTLQSLQTATPKVYGVKRLLSSSDTRWERIEDSVGLVANATHDGSAVRNDFDNIYPWSDIITYNYDDEELEETAVFGDENFSFNGSNGQVLTRIPEFYYKREQKNGYEYIYISEEEQEGYTQSETFSVGRYTMSGDASKVYSRSGVTPLVNTTITDFRNYARNLGKDENNNYYFGQLDWRYFVIQLLYLVEYADYNSQSVLGLGNTNNTAALISGGCNDLGMKSGTLNNDGKHSMIYRGIEDIFGNVWQFVDGINIKDHVAYINYNPSSYISDDFGENYQMLGYTNAIADTYITYLGYDSNHPLVAFPTSVGGTENTYVSDYYLQNAGNRIARVGGNYDSVFGAGFWYWSFHVDLSWSKANGGARLLRYK